MTESSAYTVDGFTTEVRHDDLTGRARVRWQHRSGLTIDWLPFPGFARRFAAIGVPFGAIHRGWQVEGHVQRVPAGTAHFLEHCMFSRDENGGLAGDLASLGASANAYTSHTHTVYHFSSVAAFEVALQRYLRALLQPDLSEARVAAEQPIILAELAGYRDDPESRCLDALLSQMYSRHPIRDDVIGTAQSVASIKALDLQAAWSGFYHPSRLRLTLAGDLEPVPLLEQIAQQLDGISQAQTVALEPVTEPAGIAIRHDQLQMDVGLPTLLVGIKDPDAAHLTDARELAVRRIAGRLLGDCLLSAAAPMHAQLLREGLIDDSFGFYFEAEPGFGFLICGGDSARPEETVEALRRQLPQAIREGLPKRLFETQKRAVAGHFVRSLDAPEQAGMLQTRSALRGLDLFDYPAIYDMMNADQASRSLAYLMDASLYSSVIVTAAGGRTSDEP